MASAISASIITSIIATTVILRLLEVLLVHYDDARYEKVPTLSCNAIFFE